MQHLIKVLGLNLRNKIIKEFEYKLNFFSGLIIEAFYLASIIIFFAVVFGHIDAVKNWTLYEIIIYSIITDVSSTLMYLFGFWIDSEILEGNLVNYLTKPVSEFVFYVQFNLLNAIFILLDLIVISFVSFKYIETITLFSLILGIILFIASIPTILLPFLIIRSLAFWFGAVWQLDSAYRSLIFNLEKYPINIFHKYALTFFVIITPAGYLHWYIPTAMLLNKISINYGLLMLLIIIVLDIILFILFLFIYKKGLKQYEGFGG